MVLLLGVSVPVNLCVKLLRHTIPEISIHEVHWVDDSVANLQSLG